MFTTCKIMPDASQLLSILLFTLRAHYQDKQSHLKESRLSERQKKHLYTINAEIRLQKEKLQAKLNDL